MDSSSTLETLPFNGMGQKAVIGHIITNEQFYHRAIVHVKPEWFLDPQVGKLWNLINLLSQKYKRQPTEAEVRNTIHQKAIPHEAHKLDATLIQCMDAAKQIRLENVRSEATEWLKTRIYHGMVKKSTDFFNAKKFQEAYAEMGGTLKELDKATFETPIGVDVSDLDRLLYKQSIEHHDALTFGSKLVDKCLLELDDYSDVQGSLLPGDTTILLAPVNIGKCLGKDTLVIMADGSRRKVQNVQPGELLMSPTGEKPIMVLNTTSGVGPLYKIKPTSGGDAWVCNDVHVLSLKSNVTQHNYKAGQVINIPLNEYLTKSQNFKNFHLLWRGKIDNAVSQEYLIPPYILGLWLGDGTSSRPSLTTMDDPIRETWINYCQSLKLRVGTHSQFPHSRAKTYAAYSSPATKGKLSNNIFTSKLRKLGVLNNKHIPHIYLMGSTDQRLELLAGIIDTDGHRQKSTYTCNDGSIGYNYSYQVYSKFPLLAQDIAFLARSLGLKVSIKQVWKENTTTHKGDYYSCLTIQGDIFIVPVKLKRKQAPVRQRYSRSAEKLKNSLSSGFKVESVGDGEYFGFELDGDHLFMLGDFTVTHNTSCMVTVAAENIRRKKHVLFMTHEGREEDIMTKLWCSLVGTTKQGLRGLLSENEMFNHEGLAVPARDVREWALQLMREYLVYIPMNKAGGTIEDVVSIVRDQHENLGNRVGHGFHLWVDDYPATLTTVQAQKGMARRERDDIVYGYVVDLAGELKFHSLCAIQSNREGSKLNRWGQENNSRLLGMEDASESFGPMQRSTNVITLNRDGQASSMNRLTFAICKSRSSKTGWAVVCKSNYDFCRTHSDRYGGVYFQSHQSMSEKVDHFLDQYSKLDDPVVPSERLIPINDKDED